MTLNILVDTKKEKVMDMLRDDGTNAGQREVGRWLEARKRSDGPNLARVTVSKEHGVRIAPIEVEHAY